METNFHKKFFFPNDVGLPPTFLKHVSNQSEFILKHFNFLGIYLWEFEIRQIAIIWNLYGIKSP